jgi:5-methylcytosine-specific restriction endonuclease McrA
MQSVLLLNTTYEPLKIISWQRAVSLFFSGKVEVVDEYNHNIRSVSIIIRAPSVVRLLNYTKIIKKTPPLCRANILARDKFTCQYCSKELKPHNATIDHLLPRSRGGKTTWENLACACAECNRKKGDKTPKEAKMHLLSKPYKPDWLPVIQIKLRGEIPNSWYTFLNMPL